MGDLILGVILFCFLVCFLWLAKGLDWNSQQCKSQAQLCACSECGWTVAIWEYLLIDTLYLQFALHNRNCSAPYVGIACDHVK